MDQLPVALAPLGAYRQFIVWRKDAQPGQRAAKVPVSYVTGNNCDAHNPLSQTNFIEAAQAAARLGDAYGVGFVFTEADPFWFLDIDDCWIDGAWSPMAVWACEQFDGAAVEVSQSGTGLHIIGTGRVGPHTSKCAALGIDLYTDKRFIALTGTGAQGDAGFDHTARLLEWVDTYYPPPVAATVAAEWTTEPMEGWAGIVDDDALIAKALASKSTFSNKASFQDLWEANEDVLGRCFPDDHHGRPYDASTADSALAHRLAFWTGNDCARIDRLMRQSGLFRDKWDARGDYMERTILGVLPQQTTVYGQRATAATQPPAPSAAPAGELPEGQLVTGSRLLTVNDQLQLFNGCVYVQDAHRILTPGGQLLNQERFRAVYGGYEFMMDAGNSSKPSKNAFEAFTESRGIKFPKVEGVCFRPQMPPGAILDRQGRALVNTYVPVPVKRIPGVPEPFLDHLHRVLPNENDAGILLAYMAACVQYPGVKFQWAPLLQGVEGNGKTLFTSCVAEAVGERYSHLPQASDIDNKFNAWRVGKIFVGVEDVYVPNHKQEILEILKPMITGVRGEIQAKGVDQVTAELCCNFMFNTNRKDALRKTRNDRRFAVFYSGQQDKDDLERDGMGGAYFYRLYQWLKANEGDGFAMVSNYLAEYPIPDELNPATHCHRAPETSSTGEAIAESMGGVEQEIEEACKANRYGFAKGWISSTAVEDLLRGLHLERQIPPRKRRALLQSLGYDHHPGLPDGRVNNPVDGSTRKPRLYVQPGSPHAGVTGAANIRATYIKAQKELDTGSNGDYDRSQATNPGT